MPVISRFFGIVVRMHFDDHAPPHFHAVYGEHEAVFDIETHAEIRGTLPSRARALVVEWARLHQSELRIDWELARRGRPLAPIEPLSYGSGLQMLRIRIASAIGPARLRLVLSDGSIIERDVAALLAGPVFEGLRRDGDAFARVHVEDGTVAWEGGVDLCPDVVIWGGAPPNSPTARPPRHLVVPRPPDG